jgi:hypothetical protein
MEASYGGYPVGDSNYYREWLLGKILNSYRSVCAPARSLSLLIRKVKSDMVTTGDWACKLVSMGFVIFPLMPDTKIPPEDMHWSTMSTLNGTLVREWWDEFPEDNIGINCGESGILVVDLDSTKAADLLDEISWDHDDHLSLKRTAMVTTKRGFHFYFEMPAQPLGNTAGKLGPGIDTRGAGGMVLGPGSVRDGTRYRLDGDLRNGILPLPGWLDKLLRPKPQKISTQELLRRKKMRQKWFAEAELKRQCRRIEMAPDGEQNNRLNQAAYLLASECVPPLNPDQIEDELLGAAERGNHPRTRAQATVRSGLTNGLAAACLDGTGPPRL